MGIRKGRKILFTATEMEEANSDTPGTSNEAEASNKLASIKGLKVPSGHELMEDINWYEANQDPQNICLAVPLPDTPVKPPPKKVKTGGGENAKILEAICVLCGKHDDTFRTISTIKTITELTSKQPSSNLLWMLTNKNKQWMA